MRFKRAVRESDTTTRPNPSQGLMLSVSSFSRDCGMPLRAGSNSRRMPGSEGCEVRFAINCSGLIAQRQGASKALSAGTTRGATVITR